MRKPRYAKQEKFIRPTLERLLKLYGWETVRYACNRFLKVHAAEHKLRRTIEAKHRELDALQRKLRAG